MEFSVRNKYLLKRSEPMEGESLRGFILRISERNLLEPDCMIIYKSVGLKKYNKTKNILIPDEEVNINLFELSILLGVDQYKLDQMLLFNQISTEIQSENMKKQIRHLGTCLNKQRICPECFKMEQFHKSIWEISLLTVCPTHKCLMVDFCKECGRNIDPYRKELLFCKCGFDFRNSEVICMDSLFSSYLTDRFNNKAYVSDDYIELNNLSIFHLLLLIINSAKWINGKEVSHVQSNFSKLLIQSNLTNAIDEGFRLFWDWPNNFFVFIDQLRISNNRYNSIGNINKILKENINDNVFSFIHEQVDYYFMNHWQNGFTKQIAMDDNSYKKISAKISARVLRGEQKANQFGGISKKQASTLLGVGLDQIDYFREKNIITPISGPTVDGNPFWKFSEAEIHTILEKVENQMSMGITVRSLGFYRASQIAGNYELSMADFLYEILQGNINASSKVDGQGLSKYHFDEKKIRSYLQNGFISIKEISERLQVKRNSVERWVKQGYINVEKTMNSGNHQLITINDYSKFRMNFVAVVEIVRIHNSIGSSEKLLRVLGAIGVFPINSITAPGDRYLLERSERLNEYLSNVGLELPLDTINV
ncbi:TniQ family protein [Paenibacillus sp. MAH-36]|uniref:TniQ family protein n=1 Tax=Paenibacillus violae TaxID=3077234 RepID=A0ABU3RIU4_9BACL|nr:TniQ family protein [Paenibacillus sp. PFR10]MDU0204001.1 TniQ family protein [Paenibacillus sp. PFR10]